ncbi:potassium-transporting ATPase subunit F, partial [Streptomyces sp. SID11233]|nr:potassium-transporting ATPase subunit F [Streptomyces sp. SID11233]
LVYLVLALVRPERF